MIKEEKKHYKILTSIVVYIGNQVKQSCECFTILTLMERAGCTPRSPEALLSQS